MKRIFLLLLCMTLLMLTACADRQDAVSIPSTNASEAETEAPSQITDYAVPEETTDPLIAVSVPLTTDSYHTDDGSELFSYSYQHMSLTFPDPDVAHKVTLEFLNRVDTTQTEANNALDIARYDYQQAEAWTPYFYRVIYNPKRIDHSVLSLFGMQSSYSGGMHADISGIAANYDMLTGDVLTFGSIMHPEAQKEEFILLVLSKLEEEKDQLYLYDDYEQAVRQRLEGDENLFEDFYFTTTGLNFFFSPYEIAPYSSGIVTVEIPYNELPGLLFDDYFPAERQIVDGSLNTETLEDLSQYNNMVEVILDDEDKKIAIYPEGTVEDIQFIIAGDRVSIPEYTVFMAFELSGRDAVLLYGTEDHINNMTITYHAGNENHMISIDA